MASYQCGSTGQDVVKIQTQLRERSFYKGPLDGNFGGGTESAVRLFQRSAGLETDGVVGPSTWAKLFSDNQPTEEPAIKLQPLNQRCLALTGSFETNSPPPECYAGLAGNFDGQGLSFGACQWNLGQQTLQPLFAEMAQSHATILADVMHDYAVEFLRMLSASLNEQLAWANSIQDARHRIVEPWQGLFKTLARTPQFEAIEVAHAARFQADAAALCQVYGVTSERAIALMFDIRVQNGGISDIVQARIERDFGRLSGSLSPDDAEVARLIIIANRRAEAASSQWVEDVRVRKLTIANGTGTVHGRYYDLDAQYGITLKSV
jgi:hypothetical protein